MFVGNIFSDAVAAGVDTGDIGHSLRFRGAQYLNRTPGGAGSRRILTYSAFLKVSPSAAMQRIFVGNDTGSSVFNIAINASNQLEIVDFSGSYLIRGISTRVFRDPTAHIHLVVALDTNQATFANAVKVWVNNEQITSWGTSTYSGAHDMQMNDTRMQGIGVYLSGGVPTSTFDYYGGYLSRVCLVDGSQLTPSSFGYFNTEINEWVTKSQSAVKAVVDAGGTNSFMLDFDDATSLTTLGYDKSSKGNNWTLNNFSLTAGTNYDRMLDVPGNSFATLNPLIPSAANISNGNLTSGTTAVRGSVKCLDFDAKWEVTAGGSNVTAGVISSTGTTNTTTVTANKTFAFRLSTAGALDYKNVTDGGAWTSITTGLTGEQYPYSVTQAANWNFGQAPLHSSATYQAAAGGYFFDTTTGFKALCQRNMPDPAILNPELHFDVVLATGANIKSTAEALYSSNFFEWIKDRANSNNHQLIDIVRGSSAVLQSNTTAAETTYSAPSGTSVGWVWKAGGASVTNNAGSISSQVSANVEAGFSIVTYTGTGANATVGHGLGVAPKMVIVKNRDIVSDWITWHTALLGTEYLLLDSTIAKQSSAAVWNSTIPASTVFSVGTNTNTNGNTNNLVAYCFAEIAGFSKVFSYTGNGSADGPFVHCGFKPKFVLVKSSTGTESWYIFDAARNTYNAVDKGLFPNLSNAETTSYPIDFTANGFKLRVAGNPNTNTATYVGIAFADVPAKYSLAR